MAKPLFKIDPDSIIGTKNGYKYCTTTPEHPRGEKRPDRDKRYVYYHVALMELYLGRYLSMKKGEEVHHKDENPSNNAISNLILTTHADHAGEHADDKEFWKKSPMNKPGRKASLSDFIRSLL